MMVEDGQRIGVEFKRAEAPALTPSMKMAMQDPALQALYGVYPGTGRCHPADRTEAVRLQALLPVA